MNARDWLRAKARMRAQSKKYATGGLVSGPRPGDALLARLEHPASYIIPAGALSSVSVIEAAVNLRELSLCMRHGDQLVRCGCFGRYSECRCERNST